jgi:RNA polymerase sigma-70 factor (ECF subfamily)
MRTASTAAAVGVPQAAIIGGMDDGAGDEELMLAYAAGDAGAFERLYARHERPVFRFLSRSLGGRTGIAEELLQEVWLAVVRNAAHWEPRAKFTTWLYGIARSRLIDHWRADRPTFSLDDPAANDAAAGDCGDAGDPAIDRVPAPRSDEPEVRALAHAEAQAFVAAVERLPAVQREAFLLHAEAGLALAEIAQLTGAGAETVKSRLRYAMDKLRAAMEEWQ